MNQFSFDWSFGSFTPEPRRLPTQLCMLKMQMEKISDSNYLCERLVLASAASLSHLRLDPDDATPESYMRMFTSVAGSLATLDCRMPGGRWSDLGGGLRVLAALRELVISVEAFVEQAIVLSLAAMTTRTRLRCLTLGQEEWPDAFRVEKPLGDRRGYGSLLVQLVKAVRTERVRIRKEDWEEYHDRATKHSAAAVRDLAQFEQELERRDMLLELI